MVVGRGFEVGRTFRLWDTGNLSLMVNQVRSSPAVGGKMKTEILNLMWSMSCILYLTSRLYVLILWRFSIVIVFRNWKPIRHSKNYAVVFVQVKKFYCSTWNNSNLEEVFLVKILVRLHSVWPSFINVLWIEYLLEV